MILHIPHSSTFVPETFKVLNGVSLDKEYQRMTDWFTDELFDCEAKKLVFPYSRLYCDVERFRDDNVESMAEKGMGVCYEKTSFGTKLRDINNDEKEFIKSTHYDLHHRRLEVLVEEELKESGSSLIIDCHSFSNEVLPHEESNIRPDICLGTDNFHTSIELLMNVHDCFKKEGLNVVINKPFSGTMVPLRYYRKDKRIQSIMIEINRKLYLDENFRKNENFYKMKQLIQNVLKNINQT